MSKSKEWRFSQKKLDAIEWQLHGALTEVESLLKIAEEEGPAYWKGGRTEAIGNLKAEISGLMAERDRQTLALWARNRRTRRKVSA